MNTEAREMIGKTAYYRVGALYFEVEIKDYAFKYGNNRFLITPCEGVGEAWVERMVLNLSARLRKMKKEKNEQKAQTK